MLSLAALLVVVSIVRLAPDLARYWTAGVTPRTAGGVPGDALALARVMLFELHGPRVLAALAAGASFGLAGAVFQALARNDLASPDVLGVTGGAQFGLLLVMLWPALAGIATPLVLFGAGLVAAGVVAVAAGGWRATALRLLLAGSVCALLFSAMTTLALAWSEQSIAGVALWSSGSLYQPGAQGLMSALVWLALPLAVLPPVVRSLDVLSLGERTATMLGVRVDAVRFGALVAAVGCTSVAVAIAGPMAYVGLVAPNLVRRWPGLRAVRVARLSLCSALAGALLVSVTDAAVLALDLDGTLSTGVAVALVGAPLMLALIVRDGLGRPPGVGAAQGGALIAPAFIERWARRIPPIPIPLALLALMLLGVAVLAVAGASGPVFLAPARWWAGVAGHDAFARTLLLLRLPRAACALLAGALLAASGVLMQSVVRNPLAGPEVLGVTQGASLAVLIAMALDDRIGHLGTFAASLTGAMATLALVLALNRRTRYAPLPVALSGLVLGTLATTLAQWLIAQASLQPARFVVWLAGGTYGRGLTDALSLLPWGVLAIVFAALLARPLDLLALGDDQAAALGVPTSWLRMGALVCATLLACAAVAVVGPIGFVGLMAPHAASLLGARSHRSRLLLAVALGGLITAAADIGARTIVAPREVPAGALTAMIGAPYLLVLLVVQARRERAGAGR
nr:iron ABC transporter permease [Trinickia diaoshuihuensis]